MINKKLLQGTIESRTISLTKITAKVYELVQVYDYELSADPETPGRILKSLLSQDGRLEIIEMLCSMLEEAQETEEALKDAINDLDGGAYYAEMEREAQ